MVMNVFLITTYGRKDPCQRLVNSLQGLGDIFVLNDGDSYEITDCEYYYNEKNLGKRYYWHTVNRLWGLPKKVYDYYFMISDDFLPIDGFTDKAIALWRSIKDNQKICLNLYCDPVPRIKCWTNVEPIEYKDYRITQWVDMCFMAERRFFNEIGKIPTINYNWDKYPLKSSGVGSYISTYLYRHKFNMYQVKESLCMAQPEHNESKLHDNNTDSQPAR